MNRILILCVLFCASLSSVFADKLVDKAHLLGSSEFSRLDSYLDTVPVWIETYDTVPNDNIKRYADDRVAQLASNERAGNCFIVVVTTHPRAWRISMYPVGFVGGEATRSIGDAMMQDFKRGHFYEGLQQATTRLANLTVPVAEPTPPAAPIAQVVDTPAPTTRSRHYEDNNKSDVGVVILGLLAVLAVIGTGILLYYYSPAQKAKRKAEIERLEAEERKAKEEQEAAFKLRRQREKERAEREAIEEVRAAKIRRTLQAKNEVVLEAKKTKLSKTEKERAQKAFNSYTAEQRRSVVNNYTNHAYYSPGILSDPLMFYLFMTMVAPTQVTYQPPTPSRSNDDSYRSRSSSSSSSSDSSGSSSSWDSGSSSDFSSSDSSGSGGSW